MKWLKLFLALVAVLVLAAAGLATWLAGTEAGLRYVLARAAPALPLEFDPGAAEGSLAGPLRLPAATWSDAGTRVELHGLELDWRPVALLRRRVELTLVQADELRVSLPPAEEPAAGAAASAPQASLPWPLRVDELRIGALAVSRADDALVDNLAIELAGTLIGGQLELNQFRLSHPLGAIEGRARGALDVDAPLAAGFDWQATYQDFSVSGQATLAGPLADLEVEVTLATPLVADVAGRVRGLPQAPAWDLAVEADPLPATGPWPAALAGIATRLDFRGALAEGGFAGRVENFAAWLQDSRLEGSGDLAWHDGLALDLELVARDLDPGLWVAEWPGRLDGRIAVQTPAGQPGTYLVRVESVTGQLRGFPLEGAAEASLDAAGSVRGNARLAAHGSQLAVSGRGDREALELEATVVADDLGAIVPEARGSLAAEARITGAPAAPVIALTARGRGLAWRGLRGREAELEAEIDVSGAERSALRLDMSGVGPRVGRRSRVQLVGSGTPADHELRLEFSRRRPAQSLVLAVAGGLADSGWQGTLQEAQVAEDGQPLWALDGPAPVAYAAERFSLQGACLDGIFGLLCVDGATESAGAWRGQAALAGLDLGRLSEWLNLGLQASGTLTGGLAMSADETRFTTLTGGVGLSPGLIRVRGETDQPLLAWHGGAVELSGDAHRAAGALRLLLAGDDHLDGQLAIGWNDADPPLDGSLTGEVSQLGLIRELVPELGDLGGRVALDAVVSGTLGAPEARVAFRLREGHAYLPGLGIRPDQLELDAMLEEDSLRFILSGRSGEGRFEGHGDFDLAADGVAGTAYLQGDSVLVADLPDVRLTASPDLDFRYVPGRLAVQGTVTVPSGIIRGLSSGQAITPSPDEVIVGPRRDEEEDELEIRSRLRLVVGPAVEVQAFGFFGRVEGELLTVIAPDADPWGRGELRVQDGNFAVFGQSLDINTGRLVYDGGPLDTPSLEIRAERETDAGLVGALIRGTFEQPEISLYSDPTMPRSEILANLALGKGVNELDSAQQGNVNQAANALGLSGGSLVVQDLARRLGLEGLSISAQTSPDETSLVVSQYLGGGLYVSYGVGLFDTVNTLRLRYQVNRRLSLEATSGEEEAAEVYYTFERD